MGRADAGATLWLSLFARDLMSREAASPGGAELWRVLLRAAINP